MIRLLLLACFLCITLLSPAGSIIVRTIGELNKANTTARPGDTILLQDGEWKNVDIRLTCSGTKEQPIVFKAQTAGKVMITGNSMLKLGGNYITVEGLFFTKGYAGNDPVIEFRSTQHQVANHCRVTNCAIDDFNNPKRMDENNWVLFYGKQNQVDHCSFKDKKNMGVLMAVVLDDERSRENSHIIERNYFGKRLPLGSNGGEIIRVGVSQHCQYNSNTEISGNLFDQCDGEAEIISIKSGGNVVQENIFKECQGSVVLRHGDNNLVTSNIFLGNEKPATGGVRVINKGQKVNHNIFYKCRGESFRSPLTIMNGIPNSPAHRYVQVTDAEITTNTFYECSPISLCEGSDAERTLPPVNVVFANNIFYNSKDSIIYKTWDDISGISFRDNEVSKSVSQATVSGFEKKVLPQVEFEVKIYPAHLPTFANLVLIHVLEKQTYKDCGAPWLSKTTTTAQQTLPAGVASCRTADQVYEQLEKAGTEVIRLTGSEYHLTKPFIITRTVSFIGNKEKPVHFRTGNLNSVFEIRGNGKLILSDANIDGSAVKATHFIASDSSGPTDHYNIAIHGTTIRNLDRKNGCQDIVYAHKSMFADSIVIRNNSFRDNNCNFLVLAEETENKGYYNAENIIIGHNNFKSHKGTLINIYRGGNDESTLGPQLYFSHNKIENAHTIDKSALIQLTGVQVSHLFSNRFKGCNSANTLVLYKDTVHARHTFEKNVLFHTGILDKNNFVTEKDNTNK